jgi:hypothetical protein
MNRNDDRIASSDPGLRVRTAVADEYSKIEKEMAIAGAQEVDQFNTQASPGGFSLTRTRVRRAGRRGDGIERVSYVDHRGLQQRPACSWRRRNPVMRVWSVIGLLFTAAIVATIPVSPQMTPRGLELSVDQAQAKTHGRYRRVTRRAYYRGYYGAPGYSYGGYQPIGGGGGQWYPW